MARKRALLILDDLAQKSAVTLKSMVMELTGGAASLANDDDAKASQWSRRFAASGKILPLRPLRTS